MNVLWCTVLRMLLSITLCNRSGFSATVKQIRIVLSHIKKYDGNWTKTMYGPANERQT